MQKKSRRVNEGEAQIFYFRTTFNQKCIKFFLKSLLISCGNYVKSNLISMYKDIRTVKAVVLKPEREC